MCISWAWGRSTRLSLPRVIWCDLALSWSAKPCVPETECPASDPSWVLHACDMSNTLCLLPFNPLLSGQDLVPGLTPRIVRLILFLMSAPCPSRLRAAVELAGRTQMWSRWYLATIKNRTFYPVQSFLQQSLITYWKVLVAFNQNCSLNLYSLEVLISRFLSAQVHWELSQLIGGLCASASQIIFFYWLRLRDFPRQAIVPTLDQLLLHSQCPEQSRGREYTELPVRKMVKCLCPALTIADSGPAR